MYILLSSYITFPGLSCMYTVYLKTGRAKGHNSIFKISNSEKFRNYSIFFICILLVYVAHEMTKDF